MSTKIKMITMALLAMMGLAAYAQTPKELVEQGYKHSENGDYDKAIECYRKAAQQGDAQGQDELGGMYLYGAGVEVDYATALDWFRKSAAQGFAEGQRDVGLMYHYGLGVEQDYQKALEWYNKAAKHGNAHAEKGLGDMYYSGEGVQQSYEQAASWFRKAADHNDREAQNALGNCYYSGKGVQQSYEEAVKWYRKSAEQGFWWGEHNLGNMYAEGKGVPQDYGLAMQWFKKASDHGLGQASQAIAMLYFTGKGMEKDQKKAVEWFSKGAEQGYAVSQGDLGYCYENGYGVEKDIDMAKSWYQKAAEQGNENAKNSLDRIKTEEKKNTLRVDKIEFRGREIKGVDDLYDLGSVLCEGENNTFNFKLFLSNVGTEMLKIKVRRPDSYWRLRFEIKGGDATIASGGHAVVDITMNRFQPNEVFASIPIHSYDNDELIRNVQLRFCAFRSKDDLVFVKHNDKWGAIDINNQTLIPYEYESVEDFGKDFKVTKNGKIGFVIRKSKVSIPCVYDETLDSEFKNGYLKVKKDDNFYVITENNTVAFKLAKSGFGNIMRGEGDILVFVKDGKLGYIDKDYKILIPAEYTAALPYGFGSLSGVATVEKNGKWGLVDKTNHVILPFEYESIIRYISSIQAYVVTKNGKQGLVDKTNHVILPFEFECILVYSSSEIHAEKNDKWGVIDSSNRVIIPFEYESIDSFTNQEGPFVVKKNGKWGKIDKYNKIITPFNYDTEKDVK